MMRQYLLGMSLLVAAMALGAEEEAETPLDAEAWEQLMVVSAQLYQAGDFDGCTAGYTRALRNVNTRKTRKFEPWRVERAQVGLGGCHLRGGRTRAAEVAFYDPYIPVIRPSREHAHWAGTKSVAWKKETISSFDVAIIATAHQNVDYQQLVDWSQIVIDTRNATRGLQTTTTIVRA